MSTIENDGTGSSANENRVYVRPKASLNAHPLAQDHLLTEEMPCISNVKSMMCGSESPTFNKNLQPNQEGPMSTHNRVHALQQQYHPERFRMEKITEDRNCFTAAIGTGRVK
jgi:hypothetical protein